MKLQQTTPEGHPPNLKRRLIAILGAILIVAGPIAVVAGLAFTMMMPRTYSAEAIIQVIFPEKAGGKYDGDTLARLTQTQAKLVASTPALRQVIANLDLQKKWGVRLLADGAPLSIDDCQSILERAVCIRPIPGTAGLLSIRVSGEDPDEAANMANELASVYRAGLKDQPQQGGIYQMCMVNPALPSLRPVAPNFILNVVVSLAVAAILVLTGIALLLLAARTKGGTPPPAQTA